MPRFDPNIVPLTSAALAALDSRHQEHAAFVDRAGGAGIDGPAFVKRGLEGSHKGAPRAAMRPLPIHIDRQGGSLPHRRRLVGKSGAGDCFGERRLPAHYPQGNRHVYQAQCKCPSEDPKNTSCRN